MIHNRKSKTKTIFHKSISLLIAFMMVFAQVPYVALAQYTGGSYGGDEESSLKGGVYTGGSQTGTAVSSSATGSLAHGAATQLVFTQIPSASKHGNKFERQPKVEIRDDNNNLITTDNSTQVSYCGSAPNLTPLCPRKIFRLRP